MQPRSMKDHLEKQIFRQAGLGFALIFVISLTVTFFLAKYKMSTDLEKSADALVSAFRSRILDGNVKAAQKQMARVLSLRDSESVNILNPDLTKYYLSPGEEAAQFQPCSDVGITCFEGFLGNAKVFLPIYFDIDGGKLFGYLYLNRKIQFDFLYVCIVFLIFSIGYIALLMGVANISRQSLTELSEDLLSWSTRLKENPKQVGQLSNAPFSELAPLREAIKGLNAQIETFELRAGEKAKLLTLRGIAHDILGPISQVKLFLATLEKKSLSEDSSGLIAEIKNSVAKVSAIASQVKSLNSSAEDAEPLNLTNAVLSETAKLAQLPRLTSKNIKVRPNISTADTVFSRITDTEVSRILQNLMQNSADASEIGASIEVNLSLKQGFAVLRVKDSGGGIPESIQEKIFEPDYTSKSSTGTGLGLFIVRHIVEQRDGTIEVKSEVGLGTTVSIRLPIVEIKPEFTEQSYAI